MTLAAHSPQSIATYLAEWIARKEITSEPFETQHTLEEIGFDSLSIVDLAQALKRELSIVVPPAELEESATFAQTVDLIVDHSVQGP